MFRRLQKVVPLLVAVLAGPLVAPALGAVTVSDSTFVDADWSLTKYVIGAGGGVIATATPTGNPANGRIVKNVSNGMYGYVMGVHIYKAAAGLVTLPCDLASLEYSIDYHWNGSPATDPQLLFFAIEQGGVQYVAAIAFADVSGAWVTQTATLTPGAFARADGMPGSPSFSAGTSMRFGFASQTRSLFREAPPFVCIVIYDNFSVTGHFPNGDINGDCATNGADLGLLLSKWGPCAGCAEDLNGDGQVDGADLGLLIANWSG